MNAGMVLTRMHSANKLLISFDEFIRRNATATNPGHGHQITILHVVTIT